MDSDASLANTATNGGDSPTSVSYKIKTPKFTDEWFRWKEEVVNLRSHLDVHESSCTALFIHSSEVEKKEAIDDLHVGKPNVEEISTLDSYQYAIKETIGRSSRGKFPHGSSITQRAAKIGADDRENDTINVIASNRHVPASSRSTEKKSDFGNDDKEKNAMKITRLHSRTRHFEDDGPNHWNAGMSNKSEIDTSGISNNELSPAPFRLHSRPFEDEQEAKENTGIETHRITNDPCPPPQLRARFADNSITEKLSQVDASTKVTERPVRSADRSPPAEDFSDMNQGEVLHTEDVVQQSRAMRPGVNNNDGLPFLSPSVILRDNNHLRADVNVPSQSLSHESVHEENDKEDAFVIHGAFLVEEDAPLESADVRVAELFEPDQSVMLFTKFHVLLLSLCIVATLLAVGITFYFTRVKSPSIKTDETFAISSPLPQTPSLPPSSSSLVVMPSLQLSMSVRFEIERNVLQRNVTFGAMGATDDRDLALKWITDIDPMNLDVSDSNLFQRYILALLAFDLSNLDWLSNGSECEWFGVECDVDGNVIKLELNSSSLYGTMPPEVCGLQSLQTLLLRGNSLSGTLPSELGYLKDLTVLDLKSNNFTGTLPSEIGNLTKLTKLVLRENEFTGTLPSELGYLKDLSILYLESNKFSGTLPSEIGNLKELTELDLKENQFTGMLLSAFCVLNTLAELSYSTNPNRCAGTLPTELGSLALLTNLDISTNNFAGTLPSQIGGLEGALTLKLESNLLTGSLPSWIGEMKYLTILHIYCNQFNGTLPSELGRLTSLTSLDISYNQFTGSFPTLIGDFQELSQLVVNNNQFTGTFPSEVTNNLNLMQFCASNNNFTGSLPIQVQNEWLCTWSCW
ncbi:hypothetical protein ACHAW6_004794 [Cyclotella cf. meneghiniana]